MRAMPDDADIDTVKFEVRRMRRQAVIITVITFPLLFLFLLLEFIPTVVVNKWLADLVFYAGVIVTVSWSSVFLTLILLSSDMSRNLLIGKAIVYSNQEKLLYMIITFIIVVVVLLFQTYDVACAEPCGAIVLVVEAYEAFEGWVNVV